MSGAHPHGGYVVEAGRPIARGSDLWRYRELVARFALRELQVRYRQAFFGVAWALAQPLALTALATLVVHRWLQVESHAGLPFPVFAYAGLVVWTFFQGALAASVPCLVNNAPLLKKIWFPRTALPVGVVGAHLVDLALAALLWFVLLPLHGVALSATLLVVPLLLGLLAVLTAALGTIGAAVNAWYRDVKHALPLGLQLLFFATPVVYPLSAVPAGMRSLYDWNPLVGIVDGLRRAALGQMPDPDLVARSLVGTLVVGALALWVMRRAEGRMADVI